MKKLLLPVLAASLTHAAFAGDARLSGSILSTNIPVESRSESWADGEYFFGDWGGGRKRLADAGVAFESYYVANPAYNASGGKKQGGSYVDNFYLGMTPRS